jgi:hypothetical protein
MNNEARSVQQAHPAGPTCRLRLTPSISEVLVSEFIATIFAEFMMLVTSWLFGAIAEIRLDALARDLPTTNV